MNLKEMRDEVISIVSDSDFTDDAVDAKINIALQSAAGRCSLPNLKRIGTVTTNTATAYVSFSNVAGGFSGRLSRVFNTDGESIPFYTALELMMTEYGDLTEAGDVEAVCLEGNTLWYAKVPAVAEVLTLLYFQNPAVLDGDTDVPAELPEFVHRPLLVNGACELMYDEIERGVEGLKVNTKAHEYMKERGMKDLHNWLGKNKVHHISSVWSA